MNNSAVRPPDAQAVLDFWFKEIDSSLWFKKDPGFDQQIRDRFTETYEAVVAGQRDEWQKSPEGRLAGIIVLDQFPRNMFRDSPKSFATDALALKWAEAGVAAGDDQKLAVQQRSFMYMPYMHSEHPQKHERAVELFSQKGLEYNLKFELAHQKIILKFGRYPHRNAILGRNSTPEEIEFLKQPGSGF